MNRLPLSERLAVCSWSLQPQTSAELLERVLATGLHRVQLALDPLRTSPDVWGDVGERLRAGGCQIISGMVGCVGEDYSTLESIRRTGGVAPDETWDHNQRDFQSAAVLARELGLPLVTFHAGFVPHEPSDPGLAKMIRRVRLVADIFQAQGVQLALETGQESAHALVQFLSALNHPNVGVNFDPANMLLYDQGDPVVALRVLAPWIRQVHIKDARRTAVPGTWGEEVPVGTGDVVWREFFGTLRELGLAVNLVIEREAGGDRIADVVAARVVVETEGNQIRA